MSQRPTYQLAEKQTYADAMGDAISLMHQTAAGKGVNSGNTEALVDAWWATIPSQEQRIKMIPDGDGEKVSALEAWNKANEIGRYGHVSESRTDPQVRQRVLRKLQILIDVLYEMDMLFRRPRVYKTTHEDDTVSW